MVSTYQLLLFVHISAVVFWLGSELFTHLLAFRAERKRDVAALWRLFDEVNAMDHIFLPAVLLVPLTGILMVVVGPWSFGDPWIVAGLSGVGFTLVYGFLFLQPHVGRVRRLVEAVGVTGAEVPVRLFFVYWRIETVVLLAVVFAMTIRPRDMVTIGSLLGGVAVASAYVMWRARALGQAR